MPTSVAVLVAVFALLVVASSAVVVRASTSIVLPLLEGYWPATLGALERALVRFRAKGIKRLELHLQELYANPDTSTLAERARVERSLRRIPSDPSHRMPTAIGDLLRAAETKPREKYGLDGVVCWSRLWLLMPEESRSELVQSRARVDGWVEVLVWSALLLVWTPLFVWSACVAVAGVALSMGYLYSSIASFAELVEAAYDVHRLRLYTALRWPLPQNPADELVAGAAMTRYLWRGSDEETPTFSVGEERSTP
jgi:hypothetical protein